MDRTDLVSTLPRQIVQPLDQGMEQKTDHMINGFSKELQDGVGRVVLGKEHAIHLAVTTLLAGGHLLIEDKPGVGKTLLARALARCLDVPFQRVQCTADLLPADIIGAHIYHPTTGDISFRPGPVFTSILVADELNRTPPRTQSALLQGTGEALVPGPDEALAGDDNAQAGTDTLDTLGGYLETITSQVWIWSVFLLLGLFAGLRPRLGRKNSATAMPTPARPARRMLESILRTLKTRGLPRPRGQTLDRYLHNLGAGAVLDHTALADSFDAYQEVRFGSREYDDRRASRLGEGLSVARTAYKREKDSD